MDKIFSNIKNGPACMGVFVNHDPTVLEQEWEVE